MGVAPDAYIFPDTPWKRILSLYIIHANPTYRRIRTEAQVLDTNGIAVK